MNADIYNLLTILQNSIDQRQRDLSTQFNGIEREVKTDAQLLSEAYSDLRQLSEWLEGRLHSLNRDLRR